MKGNCTSNLRRYEIIPGRIAVFVMTFLSSSDFQGSSITVGSSSNYIINGSIWFLLARLF